MAGFLKTLFGDTSQRELKRIKLGTLTLSNLSRGKFRELSDSELAALKKAAKL